MKFGITADCLKLISGWNVEHISSTFTKQTNFEPIGSWRDDSPWTQWYTPFAALVKAVRVSDTNQKVAGAPAASASPLLSSWAPTRGHGVVLVGVPCSFYSFPDLQLEAGVQVRERHERSPHGNSKCFKGPCMANSWMWTRERLPRLAGEICQQWDQSLPSR